MLWILILIQIGSFIQKLLWIWVRIPDPHSYKYKKKFDWPTISDRSSHAIILYFVRKAEAGDGAASGSGCSRKGRLRFHTREYRNTITAPPPPLAPSKKSGRLGARFVVVRGGGDNTPAAFVSSEPGEKCSHGNYCFRFPKSETLRAHMVSDHWNLKFTLKLEVYFETWSLLWNSKFYMLWVFSQLSAPVTLWMYTGFMEKKIKISVLDPDLHN